MLVTVVVGDSYEPTSTLLCILDTTINTTIHSILNTISRITTTNDSSSRNIFSSKAYL